TKSASTCGAASGRTGRVTWRRATTRKRGQALPPRGSFPAHTSLGTRTVHANTQHRHGQPGCNHRLVVTRDGRVHAGSEVPGRDRLGGAEVLRRGVDAVYKAE